jgi:regulator of RNase E activity RraA
MTANRTPKLPDWLSSTLASDASEGRDVLPLDIKPLSPDSRVTGRAFVVHASQDDNQAVVQAVATPPPEGCVMVVSGMGTSRTATVGGIMAREIKNRGVIGLITDGPVRDAREIRELGLDVWCRGTTPTASNKRGPGSVGGTIEIGGILISDGDVIIADEDGVVIWPKARVDTLLRRAEAKYEADNQRLERLRRGTGT